uniref:Uncharacterized protein n=1 Tax=Rhizophora mucronata TaxID=61149 RepID=A0A2P2N5Z2_RHIMU
MKSLCCACSYLCLPFIFEAMMSTACFLWII